MFRYFRCIYIYIIYYLRDYVNVFTLSTNVLDTYDLDAIC